MPSDAVDGGYASNGKKLESVEFLLFDSLVHHLIEKGLLTRNDALSVVQTVAQVMQGRLETDDGALTRDAFAALERTYESFQALPDRHGKTGTGADNIVPLRPPLHGERPEFPSDERN